MAHFTLRSLVALTVLSLVGGCADKDDEPPYKPPVETPPPPTDDRAREDAMGMAEAPLVAALTTNYMSGLVRFQLRGTWRTGLLVRSDDPARTTSNLVLTLAWSDLPDPSSAYCIQPIDVQAGYAYSGTSPSSVEHAEVVDVLRSGGGYFALLVLDTPLTTGNAPRLATTFPSNGENVQCRGYFANEGSLHYMYGQARASTNAGYFYSENLGFDMNGEAYGWICTSADLATVWGFAGWLDSTTHEDLHVAATTARTFVNAQSVVNDLVHPTQFVHTTALASVQHGLVMDIPYATYDDAPVNQFTANGQDNQRFYWKQVSVTRFGQLATRFMLVQKKSGKCVSQTPSGVRQVACNIGDTRQLFARNSVSGFSPPSGKVDVQLVNDSTGQCLMALTAATPSQGLVAGACGTGGARAAWRIDDPSLLAWCQPRRLF